MTSYGIIMTCTVCDITGSTHADGTSLCMLLNASSPETYIIMIKVV